MLVCCLPIMEYNSFMIPILISWVSKYEEGYLMKLNPLFTRMLAGLISFLYNLDKGCFYELQLLNLFLMHFV